MSNMKFRAWDKVEGKMVYIGLIDLDDMTVYNASSKDGQFTKSYSRLNYMDSVRDWGHPDDLEFMQYTNIEDREGMPIYEGDILEFESPCINSQGYNYTTVQVYRLYTGAYRIRGNHNHPNDLHSNRGRMRVIGNVYANPELMGREVRWTEN